MMERALIRNSLIAALAASVLALARLGASALAQSQHPAGAPSPIILPEIPRIQLLPVPGYGPAPLTVGFMLSNADPQGAPLQTFAWNFGDGQVSMLPPGELFHTYTAPGSYVVTVTATTANGDSATSFAGVVVTQPAR